MKYKNKKSDNVVGTVVMILFFITGISIIITSGIFNVKSVEELLSFITKNLFLVIFSLFFIYVPTYLFILFFMDKRKTHIEDVFYLINISDDGNSCFINKKGKKVYMRIQEYEVNKFYKVLSNSYTIEQVMGPSTETFKVKDGYFGTLYIPFQKKGIYSPLVIPMVFAMLGVAFSTRKILGLILFLCLIIYDLVYKIRKKKNPEYVDTFDLERPFLVFIKLKNILRIISLLIIIAVLLSIILSTPIIGLMFIPFLLMMIVILIMLLSSILNKKKIKSFSKNLFYLLFFGTITVILSFITYLLIKNKSYVGILFLSFFWFPLIREIRHLIPKGHYKEKRIKEFLNEYLVTRTKDKKIIYYDSESLKFFTNDLLKRFPNLTENGFSYFELYQNEKEVGVSITFNFDKDTSDDDFKSANEYLKSLGLKETYDKSKKISRKLKTKIIIKGLSFKKELDKEYVTYELDEIMKKIINAETEEDV